MVNQDLFDRRLRSLRRDRAALIGPELFLYNRAFEDCLDRLRDIPRKYERALLLGCPAPACGNHFCTASAARDETGTSRSFPPLPRNIRNG